MRPRAPVVRVGASQVSWDILVWWAARLDPQGASLNHYHETSHSNSEAQRSNQLLQLCTIFKLHRHRSNYQEDRAIPILHLIFDLHEFRATETSDQVYALMGIASPPNSSTSLLPIDYRLSFAATLTNLSRDHATHGRSSSQMMPEYLLHDQAADYAWDAKTSAIRPHKFRVPEHAPFQKDWVLNPACGAYQHTSPQAPYIRAFLVCQSFSPLGWVDLVYARHASLFLLLIDSGDGMYNVLDTFQTSDGHIWNINARLEVLDWEEAPRTGSTWYNHILPGFFPTALSEELLLSAGQGNIWWLLMKSAHWKVLNENGHLTDMSLQDRQVLSREQILHVAKPDSSIRAILSKSGQAMASTSNKTLQGRQLLEKAMRMTLT